METSEGQCRGWEVREGMCQWLAGKNCHAPAGRQNTRTALGIKKKKRKPKPKNPNLSWTLVFISGEVILQASVGVGL